MADGATKQPSSRAVLVHGSDPTWRRAQRTAILALASADSSTADSLTADSPMSDSRITVLLSSREAEAAKWCADPRLSLIVARENAALRHTLASLGLTLPVLWVSAHADDPAASVDAIARDVIARLALPTYRP